MGQAKSWRQHFRKVFAGVAIVNTSSASDAIVLPGLEALPNEAVHHAVRCMTLLACARDLANVYKADRFAIFVHHADVRQGRLWLFWGENSVEKWLSDSSSLGIQWRVHAKDPPHTLSKIIASALELSGKSHVALGQDLLTFNQCHSAIIEAVAKSPAPWHGDAVMFRPGVSDEDIWVASLPADVYSALRAHILETRAVTSMNERRLRV